MRAQEPAKQHRIAIVIPAGPVTIIDDTGVRGWPAFWDQLRRSGDVEGQNLTVERYSGEGRREGFARLAREVVGRNPDLIVASGEAVARAVSAANASVPIVWIGGDPIRAGFTTSFAHPSGNITGVTAFAGYEIYGKRLQILKEAVPSASRVAFLAMRTTWEGGEGQALREAGRRLEISIIGELLQEATGPEIRRTFAEIAQQLPDAIMVHGVGDIAAYYRLVIELVEKSHLPAIYEWRDYVEAGGLMAYVTDLAELFRRMADDVHQILTGAKPSDIPIYQPTKYEFLINLKTAKALGLTIPPPLLAQADEVLE